jgi:hypothetical protein
MQTPANALNLKAHVALLPACAGSHLGFRAQKDSNISSSLPPPQSRRFSTQPSTGEFLFSLLFHLALQHYFIPLQPFKFLPLLARLPAPLPSFYLLNFSA